MSDSIVYPTGTCFDDAVEWINARCEDQPFLATTRQMMLVHAIVTNNETGEEYAHAWVEDSGMCVFAGIKDGERGYFAVRPDEYIKASKARLITRYTCRQLLKLCRQTGSSGPWKPEYLALVKDAPRDWSKLTAGR